MHSKVNNLEAQYKLTYDAFAAFRDKNELDIDKIRQIEITLQEQVDIIHGMNDKLSV